jgi:diacylglycerol kinase (ATP)
MRAVLLHNKDAGSVPGAHSKEGLLKLLRAAGYQVTYQSTRKPGLRETLRNPGDLVVIAGGDGTVGKVLARLDRRDVPVALLPLGTANNIATSLGISGAPEALIPQLPTARRRRLDMGHATRGAIRAGFLESAGVGLFADFLKAAGKNLDDDPSSRAARLQQGIELLHRMAPEAAPRRIRISADGEDLSGSYLLAVALNIRIIGPRLLLAPEGQPGDGQLDLLLVEPDRREALVRYLDSGVRGEPATFPFPLRRAHQIRMGWATGAGHLDDRVWPDQKPAGRGAVTLEVAGRPFDVLVP